LFRVPLREKALFGVHPPGVREQDVCGEKLGDRTFIVEPIGFPREVREPFVVL